MSDFTIDTRSIERSKKKTEKKKDSGYDRLYNFKVKIAHYRQVYLDQEHYSTLITLVHEHESMLKNLSENEKVGIRRTLDCILDSPYFVFDDMEYFNTILGPYVPVEKIRKSPTGIVEKTPWYSKLPYYNEPKNLQSIINYLSYPNTTYVGMWKWFNHEQFKRWTYGHPELYDKLYQIIESHLEVVRRDPFDRSVQERIKPYTVHFQNYMFEDGRIGGRVRNNPLVMWDRLDATEAIGADEPHYNTTENTSSRTVTIRDKNITLCLPRTKEYFFGYLEKDEHLQDLVYTYWGNNGEYLIRPEDYMDPKAERINMCKSDLVELASYLIDKADYGFHYYSPEDENYFKAFLENVLNTEKRVD